jgi:hypothetical protein
MVLLFDSFFCLLQAAFIHRAICFSLGHQLGESAEQRRGRGSYAEKVMSMLCSVASIRDNIYSNYILLEYISFTFARIYFCCLQPSLFEKFHINIQINA